MTAVPHAASDVVKFWLDAGPERWFGHDEAFDAEIRTRFLPLHEIAASGHLNGWEESPEGALALLLLLDQFPRNMFRGEARMYASDVHARKIADRAIARGHDESFAVPVRGFFYLPFMHSEDIEDQRWCVALTQASHDTDALKYAEQHADIIRRFGRFPHRNAILGRPSSPAELAFLQSGGFAG